MRSSHSYGAIRAPRALAGAAGGLVAVAMLAVAPAASTAMASDPAGRYTMQQTEDGMLRLDTVTGAVALCSERNGAWACAKVEDDSAGLEDKVRSLEADNRLLREKVARLESDLEARKGPASLEGGEIKIPSDEEVDKAFTFLERMLKRFKGLVQDLEKSPQDGTQL